MRLERTLQIAYLAALGFMTTGVSAQAVTFTPQQEVLAEFGRAVFFDESLSTPGNQQGCVSCHNPERGWTFPDAEINAGPVGNPGADPQAHGNIRPNTIAYASFIHPFQPCGIGAPGGGRWCGGLFWNGRAEGTDPLGTWPVGDGAVSESVSLYELQLIPEYSAYYYDFLDPSSDDFLGPLIDQALNPAQRGPEQNAGEKKVCQQVKTATYGAMYEEAFGEEINCQTIPDDNPAYHVAFMRIALAIAAFETSPYVNAFSSFRDLALYRELDCAGDPAFNGYADDQICSHLAALKNPDEYGQFPLAFVDLGLPIEQIREINRGHDLFYGLVSEPSPLNGGNPADAEGNLRGTREGPYGGGPVEFAGVGINAGCSACHSNEPGGRGGNPPPDTGAEPRQTYNDHAYHNIGIPYNRDIPDTAYQEVAGIIEHISFASNSTPDRPRSTAPGFFRDQTLRNVGMGDENGAFVKAFGHNGHFKRLEDIIHFYGTRDLKKRCEFIPVGERRTDRNGNPDANYDVIDTPIVDATAAEALANDCWPEPEFADGTSTFGNVGISDMYPEEEAAIAAYIRALTDTVIAEAP